VNTTPRSGTQLLQFIIDLLEEFPPPKQRRCQGCGSAMKFASAHFPLSVSAMNWNLSLPFCPLRDRENIEEIPSPETIH